MSRAAEWVINSRQALGWNRAVLVRRSGITRATLERLELGETSPQPATVERLARTFGVDLESVERYLAGQSTSAPLPRPVDAAGRPEPGAYRRAAPPNLLHPTLVPVPVINASAAGHGAATTDLGYEPGAADKYVYLTPEAAADPDVFAVRVTGDSAAPWVREGDVVVCSPNARQVPGALYFVQHNQLLDEAHRIKLVEPRGEDELILRSLNATKYPPVTVRRDQVAAMAMCLYVIRPMDTILRAALAAV